MVGGMQATARLCCLTTLAVLATHQAAAQMRVAEGPFDLTIEAYLNATAALTEANTSAALHRFNGFADGAVRFYGRVAQDGRSFGPRVVIETSTDDELEFGERSLVFTDSWGRVEAGWRQGLPDVLTGYAPNDFQFVSAEFGPASGRSLDPNGGLQTRFLSRGLASQIDALSILGVSASGFADRSPKLIYISPKFDGYLIGASFAPDAQRSSGLPHRDALAQAGVTKAIYAEDDVYRFGVSYAFAEGRHEGGSDVRDLHSVSAGFDITLDASLTFGASATYNGSSGRVVSAGGAGRSHAWGIAGSINWTEGPWVLGGYVQWAQAEDDAVRLGNDRLLAGEVGVAYRISERFRLFGALYGFAFDDEGGRASGDRHRGVVLLAGARLTL
jgi:hypothetical protein